MGQHYMNTMFKSQELSKQFNLVIDFDLKTMIEEVFSTFPEHFYEFWSVPLSTFPSIEAAEAYDPAVHGLNQVEWEAASLGMMASLGLQQTRHYGAYSKLMKKAFTKVLDYIQVKPFSVLEIGPGHGNYSLVAAKNPFVEQVILLEKNQRFKQFIQYRAEQLNVSHKLKFISIEELLQLEQQFGLVFGMGVFEVMEQPWEYLHEMVKKMADISMMVGGWLFTDIEKEQRFLTSVDDHFITPEKYRKVNLIPYRFYTKRL